MTYGGYGRDEPTRQPLRQPGRQPAPPVQQAQRETEIARMLGGQSSSATTMAHAREMLEQARG